MVARAWNLEEFIRILDNWGLTDVLLPFLLIFTIVFAILQKSRILGEGKKNINVVVSFVIALIVIVPHVTGTFPTSFDPVEIINQALPSVSIVIIAVIMLMILLGLFGHDAVFLGVSMPAWITLISFLIIFYIFGGAAGWWAGGGDWIERVFGEEALAVLIMLLVFGIIIGFITSNGAKEKGVMERLGFNVRELFGKK